MNYDVIVIGSGPGGYSTAVRAAQYGLKTAIVEKDPKLGGVCLHVGCVPTKALLHTAQVWDYLKHGASQGIHCDNPRFDLGAAKANKDGIISKKAKGVDFLMKKNKIDVYKGYGKLAGPGRVAVTGEGGPQTLEGRNIILATGSEARMLPGLKPGGRILTNIEILALTEVPKSMLVLGAGAVGVEFASMYNRFGTKCTVLEMLPRIVPVEDEDISKELERVFKKQGIRVETNAKASNIRETGSGVALDVNYANGKSETLEADVLLVAIGRKPNTENLGLEGTRVELDRGFVKVDGHQRTGEPGIYAIGDIVAGTPQLAHVATAEGMVAVDAIAGKPVHPIQKDRIPGATYTEPGIGSVGLTEKQARELGYDVKVGKFPFLANSKASILDSHDGFVKIVADAEYGEILGVHIVGPEAYELIGEAVTAMDAEATVDVMMRSIHAHPTLYETVGEAFNNVYGLAINI